MTSAQPHPVPRPLPPPAWCPCASHNTLHAGQQCCCLKCRAQPLRLSAVHQQQRALHTAGHFPLPHMISPPNIIMMVMVMTSGAARGRGAPLTCSPRWSAVPSTTTVGAAASARATSPVSSWMGVCCRTPPCTPWCLRARVVVPNRTVDGVALVGACMRAHKPCPANGWLHVCAQTMEQLMGGSNAACTRGAGAAFFTSTS